MPCRWANIQGRGDAYDQGALAWDFTVLHRTSELLQLRGRTSARLSLTASSRQNLPATWAVFAGYLFQFVVILTSVIWRFIKHSAGCISNFSVYFKLTVWTTLHLTSNLRVVGLIHARDSEDNSEDFLF